MSKIEVYSGHDSSFVRLSSHCPRNYIYWGHLNAIILCTIVSTFAKQHVIQLKPMGQNKIKKPNQFELKAT